MSSAQGRSIYLDVQQIRKLLRVAKPMMTKGDQIDYFVPAFQLAGEVLKSFCLAHDFEDEKDKYFRKMYAEFELLKVELREIVNDGHIRVAHPVFKGLQPETICLQLFDRVAMADEGISKWKNKLYGKDRTNRQ